MSLSIEPNPIHIKGKLSFGSGSSASSFHFPSGSFYGPVVVDVTFSNLSHFPIVFDIKSLGEPQDQEFLLIRPQRSIIPGNGAVQITIALKAEILKHSIWPFPVEPSVEEAKTLVVSWFQLNSPGVFNVDALVSALIFGVQILDFPVAPQLTAFLYLSVCPSPNKPLSN